MEAARRALDRSRPGDLVVLCVDYATEVFKELEPPGGGRPQILLAWDDDGQMTRRSAGSVTGVDGPGT